MFLFEQRATMDECSQSMRSEPDVLDTSNDVRLSSFSNPMIGTGWAGGNGYFSNGMHLQSDLVPAGHMGRSAAAKASARNRRH